jgi:hypothetical protein
MRHPSLVAAALGRLREPLCRNAFFLMLTSAVGETSGFAFYLIAARLYATEAIALSASLFIEAYNTGMTFGEDAVRSLRFALLLPLGILLQ